LRILQGPERPAWASDFGRDEFGLYAEVKVMDQVQRFRYVPAGTFTLGSPQHESGRDSDEAPVSVRLLQSFWLADSECAQGLWQEVKQGNPAYNMHIVHPVERISWSDAQHFVKLMNLRINKGINCRLPSEAEWEYAARAGASDKLPGHDLAAADDIDRIAVHVGTTRGTSRAIRGRLPNRLGLFDMLGNVWEWCQDAYAPYPVVPSVDLLSNIGNQRVVRGGSWGDKPALLRVADRHALDPSIHSAYVGMRIAIDVDWDSK
jgi:formylglycine-generating enzyme required for sulfatase activity